MKLNRRRVAAFAIVAALVCLAISGVVIWRVERALSSSRRDAAQGELLGFEVHTLGAQTNPGFEGLLSPAVYKSHSTGYSRWRSLNTEGDRAPCTCRNLIWYNSLPST